MYRVFGSGDMHSPYIIFQKYARSFNSGRAIGLLCASATRMYGGVLHYNASSSSFERRLAGYCCCEQLHFYQGEVNQGPNQHYPG
jgi:hypothetical protein